MFRPPNQAPGPRRGDVKRKIFKGFANAIGSMLVGFKQKRTKAEGFLSSNSNTPAVPSSGYNSDNPHDLCSLLLMYLVQKKTQRLYL
uniref:Uncharacterized protein n=1 Tax=Quercus lobata TaxID=97700 RepID=A0A7N2KPQ6_QUELO